MTRGEVEEKCVGLMAPVTGKDRARSLATRSGGSKGRECARTTKTDLTALTRGYQG